MNRRTFRNILVVIADVPGAIWYFISKTVIGMVLAVILAAIAAVLLSAAFAMWAVNILAPRFGLPSITYTEALALIILCRLLIATVNITTKK